MGKAIRPPSLNGWLMPASQKVTYKGFEIWIEDPGRASYFSDERPTFELHVKELNGMGRKERLVWFLSLRHGVTGAAIDFEIGPYEEKVFEIGGRLLAFPGVGFIGIATDPELEKEASHGALPGVPIHFHTLYTFRIEDRDFYRRQRRTNIAIIALNIIIIALMLISIALMLGG